MPRHHRIAPTLLATAAMMSGGCTVLRYAHMVAIEEQELFCDKRDEKASLAAYRALADEAWAVHGLVCPEDCSSGDYSWGFREGFAQFVYAGGTGEPPAVPPRPYWQLDLRSTEGEVAVRSWFAGYRRGAQLAGDGGYRQRATLSVSASLRDLDACSTKRELGLRHPPLRTEPAPRRAEPVVAPTLAPPASLPSPTARRPRNEVVQPVEFASEAESEPGPVAEPDSTREASAPHRSTSEQLSRSQKQQTRLQTLFTSNDRQPRVQSRAPTTAAIARVSDSAERDAPLGPSHHAVVRRYMRKALEASSLEPAARFPETTAFPFVR